MYYGGWGWRPYVSVAQRQAQAMRKIAQLKKKGRVISPVEIEGRGIATTFWGKAWCENLERYGDYANRLPRGLHAPGRPPRPPARAPLSASQAGRKGTHQQRRQRASSRKERRRFQENSVYRRSF